MKNATEGESMNKATRIITAFTMATIATATPMTANADAYLYENEPRTTAIAIEDTAGADTDIYLHLRTSEPAIPDEHPPADNAGESQPRPLIYKIIEDAKKTIDQSGMAQTGESANLIIALLTAIFILLLIREIRDR
jgi:hypothetical protein